MATYVLIHGAASTSWHWHRVVPLLEARGHDVVAPTLPSDDDEAGLAEYTDVVVDAVGDRRNLVVVAQSLGGFTAPLVCDRLGADLLVFVAGMIPRPGETGIDWWTNTGFEQARREAAEGEEWSAEDDDPFTMFLHDVPPDIAEESGAHVTGQSNAPMAEPWPLTRWPDVPTRVLLCRHDRFFPPAFQRRVAQERLGITPDEMDGGHVPALAHPDELVAQLEQFRQELVDS